MKTLKRGDTFRHNGEVALLFHTFRKRGPLGTSPARKKCDRESFVSIPDF
jgi:hypothetical protein